MHFDTRALHAHQQKAESSFAHPARNVAAFGIEPGMQVADFGAGSGAYVFAVADALIGSGRVYAVDVQKDLLRRIKNEADRRKLKNVEVLWDDLETRSGSKIASGSIHLVIVSNLLFQVEMKKEVLLEVFRVLKKGGRLALIDWSDSFGGMGPIQKQVITKASALALAQASHFTLLREFPAGQHHYGLMLQKI